MISHRTLGLKLLTFLVMIGFAIPLRAQAPAAPVATFEDLRARLDVNKQETIQITEENGTKYKARIAGISGNTISVVANGVKRELTESQVREISHRRPDKWWNGMLIGLGAGVATAAVGVGTACGSSDPECQAIATLVFVPVFGGIGMGTGALIDFAIRKHDTVFARPGSGTNRTLRVSPILNKKAAGVSVAFGF